MKKKEIVTILLILFFLSANAQITFEVDGIAYQTTSSTQVSVKSKSPIYQGAVDIPATVTYNSINYDVTTIKDEAFKDCYYLTSVTIPNSVTSIGGSAFYGCAGLTSVIIPNSVTTIGLTAFYGCYRLSSITIPNSITNISQDAFYDTKWYYDKPDGLVYAGKVLYKYKGTMPANTNITLIDGTISISMGAFKKNNELTSIAIPNSVTNIGAYVLYECNGLSDISVGLENPNYSSKDGVLFDKLQKVIIAYPNARSSTYSIPNTVTYINRYAFNNCTNLTSIIIPSSVTSISISAFSGCTNLLTIHANASTPATINSTSFSNVDKTKCILYVPTGSLSAYRAANYWKDFSNIVEETVTNEKIQSISQLLMSSNNKKIILNGLTSSSSVEVLNMNGAMLYQKAVTSESTLEINVPAFGVYVVRVGDKCAKVLVR